ncbi:MAG TPA: heme b synthase [Desulfatiglandales bacterium]|nr:heme b synthase [Desulfatiglandales bacterium]
MKKYIKKNNKTSQKQKSHELRILAWEVTKSCNLNCAHCRASSNFDLYPEELDTVKAKEVLDQIREVGEPIVILTGGEPLMRKDIFALAEYGAKEGLRMVIGTNGTLVTPDITKKMRDSGIKRVSVSLDGATKERHDSFRQVHGAFDRAIKGISYLKEREIEFQINTTITRYNLSEIEGILDLAIRLGAIAHHIFLLVPTGRAREIKNQELDAQEYESVLRWFYQQQGSVPLQLKATCAPQYYRIIRQEALVEGKKFNKQNYGLDTVTRGCLAGISYCFISYDGIVQPCGYLELNSGDLRESSFYDIWNNSSIFSDLRDFSKYKGKCGRCGYIAVCGGCRARAHAAYRDYLREEPLCAYNPLS